jgi:gliding motility-associated lipoprotein GldH
VNSVYWPGWYLLYFCKKSIELNKQLALVFAFCSILIACTTGNLYEKVQPVPRHQWSSNYKPRFTFDISDTTTPYRLFVIFRHSEKYNFNNVWLRLGIQSPDSTQMSSVQYELPLATNEKGWLASGMDDLYEHRIAITPGSGNFYFKKPGTYTFEMQQLMREEPLQEVYNIGLRVERVQ